MTKILHSGDWHLRDSYFDEGYKCLDFLLETAREEKPDLVLLAGDLYHRNDIKADSQSVKILFWMTRELSEIAPVGIIIGTHSHESEATITLQHISGAHNVHVSTYPEQIYLSEGQLYASDSQEWTNQRQPEAVISMLPAPTRRFFKSDSGVAASDVEIGKGLSAIMGGFAAGASEFESPHIVMGHFQVGGAYVSETQQMTGIDIEVSRDQLMMADADLICLGHLHMQQQIGENTFYSGSLFSNDYGELSDKGFYIHELERSEGDLRPEYQRSRFIKTPATKRLDLYHDMTGDEAKDLDMILYTYSAEEYSGSRVRLRIKAFVDDAEKIDKEAYNAFFESVGAEVDIEIIYTPRENVRSARIQEMDGLYEKVEENAKILDETVPPGVETKCYNLETLKPGEIIESVKAL